MKAPVWQYVALGLLVVVTVAFVVLAMSHASAPFQIKIR